MPNIISSRDPRGITVSCTYDQWEQHVVLHQEIAENIEAVVETIENPDAIYESHNSRPVMDYREMYVKEVKTASYYPKLKYTKVITSSMGSSAEIITAYSAKNMQNGSMPGKEAVYLANQEESVPIRREI